MGNIKDIYSIIEKSEMNDWVGGSNPEVVGDACYQILNRFIAINDSSRLLDFGCGIGRVLISILKHRPMVNSVTGFDIMPQVIQFCESHIASAFPAASFELIRGSNDHYDQFIQSAGNFNSISPVQIISKYGDKFTAAYAFSVFTHVEITDFQSLLKLIAKLIEPGGEFLFTAFILTPYSRNAISNKLCLFPFADTAYEADGQVFIGNTDDRLGFIAFDLSMIEQMVFEAGLVITNIEHGAWTGSGCGSSLQDVIVCRRPPNRTGAIQHVPTVERARRNK